MPQISNYRLHGSHTVSLVNPETDAVIWVGSIEQFIADNAFEDDECDDIHAELCVNGVYSGGGGAIPAWELRDKLLPVPAPGSAKIPA